MLDFPNSPTVGDVFDSKWRWDGEKWISTSSVSTPYLPIAGGTMLGPIVLAGWATANLNPVPLQQMVSRLQAYLPLTGGTLSGPLFVTGNMVASGLVQGANVNATSMLSTVEFNATGGVTAAAANIPTFYNNPTFTGSINVGGNISTPNGVYAAVVQAATYAGNVTITGSATVNGNISTGNTVYAGAVQTPQLNGNVYVTGNLNSAGQVQGNSLYARDRVDAGGGIFAGNLVQSNRGDDLAFYAPYGGMTIATAFVSNRGGGQLGLYLPYADAHVGGTLRSGYFYAWDIHADGSLFSSHGISAAGDISGNGVYGNYVRSYGDGEVSGSFNVGNNSFANYLESRGDVRGKNNVISEHGVFASNDASFGLYYDGGAGRILTFGGNWYLIWNMGNGDLTWVNPGGVNWHMAVTGFCYANMSSVGGRGGYVDFSDHRFKDAATINPTTKGLPEILQLNPVEFQYLPPQIEPPPEGEPPVSQPTPKWQLGFVAQEVAPIIPEAVNIIGVPLPDGTGGMETTDPSLGVTFGSIVAVLVNAVKELNTTLTDVNSRLAALEGA